MSKYLFLYYQHPDYNEKSILFPVNSCEKAFFIFSEIRSYACIKTQSLCFVQDLILCRCTIHNSECMQYRLIRIHQG